MQEETKKHLMNYLNIIGTYYKIENAENYSFKKRQKLLDLLKQQNILAWEIIDRLFESQIQLDRIENDKEKKSKKTELWQKELLNFTEKRDTAKLMVESFLKNNIN